MLPKSFVNNNNLRVELSSNAKLAYAYIADRMKLSIKNHWFDHQEQDYFVNYKINDLAYDLNISRSTTIRALKQLTHLGLIKKRRMFKQATRYFLPKFNFGTQRNVKSRLQNNNKSNNNNYINTVNTKSIKRNRNKSKAIKTRPKIEIKPTKEISSSDKYLQVQKQVTHKKAGIPNSALDIIYACLGIHSYKWIHVMNSAKYQAKNKFLTIHKKYKPKKCFLDLSFKYENNPYFSKNNEADEISNLEPNKPKSLANTINRVMRKAYHDAHTTKRYKTLISAQLAYFAKGMRNYFEACAERLWLKFKPIKQVNGPKIPIFKI